MSLKYYLRDYALTPEPDDFIAMVVNEGTADLQDLAEIMIRQGVPLTAEELRTVFRDMQRAVMTLLNQDLRVMTPTGIVGPAIQGVFDSDSDYYDPQLHRAQLTLIPNPDFEDEWQAALELEKVDPPTGR